MEQAFRRDYSSLDSVFDFITAALTNEGANDAAVFSIKLATEELFTNMVKYNTGAGNEITIRINNHNDTLIIEMIDDDVDPFDAQNAREAGVEGPITDRRIGGLGLRLVRSVVDKISYEYNDRRMKVTLAKQLER